MRQSWFEWLPLGRAGMNDTAPYRYLVAIAGVVAATAIRLAFLQVLGTRATYITFFPAVMVAALYGGLRAGLLATVLSALAADYFWIAPIGHFAIADLADGLGVAVFLASGTMISAITEAMHRAEARARVAEARADEYAIDSVPMTPAQHLLHNRFPAERLAAIFPVNKAFAVALAMLTVVAWLSLRNATEMLASDQSENDADDILHALDDILFTLKDAESDERALLLIGDQKYLELHRHASARLDKELDGLKQLTEDDPQQQQRLQAIEALIEEKISELQKAVSLRRSQGINATLNQVREEIGRGRMANLWQQVNEFHAEEDRLKEERLTVRAARTNGLIKTLLAGYGLSFALLTMVFLLLRRQIAKRLQAEASLVAEQEHLEETVTLRTRELAQTNVALQDQIEERQEVDAALAYSNARLDLLAEIASQLLKSYAPREVVEDLCCKVMAFLDCHVFFNFLLDKTTGRLHLNSYAGIPAAQAAQIEWLDCGVAVCGCAARDGRRIIAQDIFATPDLRTELIKGYGIQAYVCHPLLMDGEVIGTLSFGTRNRTHFSHLEIAMMQAVADQVAVAMFRQQTAEYLRSSEERLRLVLSASMTGSFEVNLVTGEGQWNEVEFELLGLKPGAVTATAESFCRFVHPDDLDRFRAHWDEAMQTGELDCEFRIVRADGAKRWLAGKGRFVYSGQAKEESPGPQAVRFLGVHYDITERKQAEEALRESETRLHTLANAMPQLAWIAQPDGYISWYNQRWYDYTGTTPEQMAGWGWQDVHDPAILPTVLAAWRASLATAQPFEMEFPLRGADGRFRQFLTRSYPLKDAEGQVVSWFGTNTDVSERKQAEECIQASLHEKEVLLKEIHHRVKNNLQVISSLVDLQADTIADPALTSLFQDVRDRVRSMAMVHEMLYRSDNLVSVDFAEYASVMLHYLWRAHGNSASRVTLALDLQPVPLAVEAAVPCGLLLNELAVNALKHAFAGRSTGEVIVSLRIDEEGLVCLGVSDNGIGFADGQDWRQKRSLGLSLVQMLTKQLKGTVAVTSNGGTTFHITFAQPVAKVEINERQGSS